jgi:hypothetical protein
MKKLLLIFFLLIICLKTFANQVDNLRSNLEVQDFLTRLLNTPKGWNVVKKVKLCSWQKLDVNNDKRSDLLVQAWINDYIYDDAGTFVAVDNGNDAYTVVSIGLREDGYLAKIINDHGQSLIIYNSTNYNYDYPKHLTSRLKKEYKSDTLVYRDRGFVEHNKNPASYQVDSVKFTSFINYTGSQSPDREMVIDNLGNAKYTYRRDNVYYAGKIDLSKIYRDFDSIIRPETLKEIYDLIDYLDIKKLKNNYSIGWTDNYTTTIRVKFSDGSVKYISDYGGEGTFGLKLLFSKYYALIKNQDWK